MNAPTSFQTVQDVINIQNSALSLVSGGMTTSADKEGRLLLERIKTQEIEKLKQLKDILFSLEKQFYTRIGITDYKQLYMKTMQWKNSRAASILQNPRLIAEIQQIFMETATADLEQVVLEFTNKTLTREQLIKIFGEEIDSILPQTAQLISAGLKGGSASRKGTLSLNFSVEQPSNQSLGFTKSTTKKGITFFQKKQSSKNKNGSFEIHFTQDIPISEQKHMTEDFFKIIKEQDQNIQLTASSQLLSRVQQKILSYLPAGNYPKANEIIARTVQSFLVDQQQIAISKNSSVIRGALGEIYWNAFFDFIGIQAIPVGFDVHDVSGKEIPVDIAFEKFGFQVKNYKTLNGIVTFNQHFDKKLEDMVPNRIPLGRFFSRTLELGDAASEKLGKFYFSKEYNIRNKEKDPQDKYSVIENRFEPISQAIFTFTEANIHKLLNMDKNISLQEADMFSPEFNGGRPIMFFINENPFPASEMIQEIINGLSTNFDAAVFININNLELNLNSFYTSAKWDTEVEPDISKRLKAAYVTYTIDIQINNLLERILSKIR